MFTYNHSSSRNPASLPNQTQFKIMKYQYAVFGNPIEQSLSPQIHQRFAAQHGLDLSYEKLLSEEHRFDDDVRQFFTSGGHGSKEANTAEAVNTMYVDGAKIIGHNTDGIGLCNDMVRNLDVTITNKHLLILGAGGATRGILQPLIEQQPSQITLVNRTLSRAEKLSTDFQALFSIKALSTDDATEDLSCADVIINATSASLDAKLPIPDASRIRTDCVCYDLSYAEAPTAFLSWASKAGCRTTRDGRGMLVEQAALAFTKWTSKDVSTAEIISKFKELKRDEIF